MHNTVSFAKENQSQIWSSFRIAKKASVKIIEDTAYKLIAEVKWYNGIIHKRSFTLLNDLLIIVDSVNNLPNKKELPKSNFHFDHVLNDIVHLNNNEVQINELQIQFNNQQQIAQENYLQALDFNKQSQAVKISAYFTVDLKTVISWKL